MAKFEVPNLAYIRTIPGIGGRLYEALHGAQQAINTMASQGNLNPAGQVQPPPAIQSVTATGDNGVLHVSIEHTAADVSRNVTYHIEHADNAGFVNPQIRHIGDSRSFSEFIGAQSRFVRAYASYPGSPAGPVLYHGGAASPKSVDGGGAIGPAPFLPSQGRSTGAPGQGGTDSSPVAIRSEDAGFDWRLQRAIPSAGVSTTPAPGSQNITGTVDQSGSGGGGGLPTTEAIIASCEWLGGVAGTNTVTGTTATAYTSLSPGFLIRIVPANANSGAVTLNVNGIGAKAVTKNGTTALSGGELQSGRTYILEYDGTRWQIIGASFPISAVVLGSDVSGNPVAEPLNSTQIWVGNGSNLPQARTLSGDGTLSNAGVLTITITSAQIIAALGYTPAAAGANATFTLNADLITGVVSGTITQT